MGFQEPKETNGSSSKAAEGNWGDMFSELETSFLEGNPRDREHVPKVGRHGYKGSSFLLMTSTDRPDTPRPHTHSDIPTLWG